MMSTSKAGAFQIVVAYLETVFAFLALKVNETKNVNIAFDPFSLPDSICKSRPHV